MQMSDKQEAIAKMGEAGNISTGVDGLRIKFESMQLVSGRVSVSNLELDSPIMPVLLRVRPRHTVSTDYRGEESRGNHEEN